MISAYQTISIPSQARLPQRSSQQHRPASAIRDVSPGWPLTRWVARFVKALRLRPVTIFRRRNQDFSSDDFSVIYRHGDGRELYVGRIFRTNTARSDGRELWLWTVEFHHRQGRTPPHDGQEENIERAEIAWRRCWDSADMPIHWPPSMRRPVDADLMATANSNEEATLSLCPGHGPGTVGLCFDWPASGDYRTAFVTPEEARRAFALAGVAINQDELARCTKPDLRVVS